MKEKLEEYAKELESSLEIIQCEVEKFEEMFIENINNIELKECLLIALFIGEITDILKKLKSFFEEE